MKILTYPFLIFFLLIFFSCSVKEEKNSFLLKDYVMRNDDSFRYEVVDTIVGDNWKEFKIKMVSGRWMSVNEIDSNEWWHWVSMVIPDDVQQTESMMIIGAGSAGVNLNGNWIGSLEEMQPGSGYWLSASTSMCFNFDCQQ